ncbi:Cytochrome c2 [Caballeronia novacaledonica]|uniref:Cytochrome c2 n=1 Tax=Caballeronia novacaledonica TaxID=1544861 RepID=A0A2U3I949_9BURK|nr:c-type cytochrome [Caballeronia novacaledonica]SPB16713.1 Cytochrome c2 [Caballeronia novacaledonica]
MIRIANLLTILALASATAHAQQDPVALGKKLTTNNCAVCHTFGKGEPNGQGPNLFGIVGKPLASDPSFKYSAGMKAAAAGKVWDDKLLDAWLSDTQSVAPGNAMTYFEGDEARRQKIIAYLRTLH